MNYDAARAYLLAFHQACEDTPFGPDVLVLKVNNKIFATLTGIQGHARINLKCEPNEALALRDIFPAILPGYHMNKKHWNTVFLDGSVPEGELQRMMDNSYRLVIATMPIKNRPCPPTPKQSTRD